MAYAPKGPGNARVDALKDYVTVNERVMAFHEKYPEGSIQCEIIQQGVDKDGVEFVMMQARAYRNPMDPRPGVGHAHETREGMINKTSMYENAETSAWGRALAGLGFEVKKGVASKEEVENAKRRAGEAQPMDPEVAKKLEEDTKIRMGLFAGISGLHTQLGLGDNEEGIAKKNKIKTLAGIESPWNAMTIEDLEKYQAALEEEMKANQ